MHSYYKEQLNNLKDFIRWWEVLYYIIGFTIFILFFGFWLGLILFYLFDFIMHLGGGAMLNTETYPQKEYPKVKLPKCKDRNCKTCYGFWSKVI